jgi:hypothetical protein
MFDPLVHIKQHFSGIHTENYFRQLWRNCFVKEVSFFHLNLTWFVREINREERRKREKKERE